MSGWIKIHRQLTTHWVWNNSDYLKWWLDILLEVNHTYQKTLIKGVLFECKRGEKLYSLDTWAKRWNTNKSKVKRFLELLQKDEMIVIKNETVTTRLTVCKYDSYQDERNDNETQVKRRRNADETQVKPIQECNNDNNEKNDIEERKLKFIASLKPYLSIYGSNMLNDFYSYWTEHGDKDKKFRAEKEKSFSVERRLETWKRNESKFNTKIKTERL